MPPDIYRIGVANIQAIELGRIGLIRNFEETYCNWPCVLFTLEGGEMIENQEPLDYANHHIFTSIGMLYSYQTYTEESRIGIRRRYPFDQDSGNVHLLGVFIGSCEVEIPRIRQARPKHDDVPYATYPAYPTYPTP